MKPNALKIDARDNVATVLADLHPGDPVVLVAGATPMVDPVQLAAVEVIPYGHKVALCNIAVGEAVYKYGATIGISTQNVAAGAHVHTHNLVSRRVGGHA